MAIADDEENLAQLLRSRKIPRREFIKRATALGLSASAVASLLEACGSSSNSSTHNPTPSSTQATTSTPTQPDLTKQHWMVDYNTPSETDLRNGKWNLLVVDPNANLDLSVVQPGTIKAVYVDVGEIEGNNRGDLKDFQNAGAILGEITDNPGVYAGDLRNSQYYGLMKKRIDKYLSTGQYNAVMLDALDVTLALSKSQTGSDDSVGNTGTIDSVLGPSHTDGIASMRAKAIEFVQQLRRDLPPDIKIMANRAFDITPDLIKPVGEHKTAIDFALAESTLTNAVLKAGNDGSYGHGDGTYVYKFWPPGTYDPVHQRLKMAQEAGVGVYGLNYWNRQNPAEAKTVETIYQQERSLGMCPYVSTPDLQSIYTEPTVAQTQNSSLDAKYQQKLEQENTGTSTRIRTR